MPMELEWNGPHFNYLGLDDEPDGNVQHIAEHGITISEVEEVLSRKIKRTPEELARLRAKREKLQRERPSLDALIESGDYEAMSQGDYFDLMQAFAELRKVRESKSLSLTEIARRSGIDKAALSRLENGRNLNPTLRTLESIARAIGVRVRLKVEDLGASSR
jgi:DNA-binding Xre family transcriptional regulator